MILRLITVIAMLNPALLNGQDAKQMIMDYYNLLQLEKYEEAMNYNYMAQGNEEDKAFLISLMKGDDNLPGYGAMLKDIQLVKVGDVVQKNGRSFASAKVILSVHMPLDHLKTEEERMEEVEMMQWSFPDASYNKDSKSCIYKQALNLICIKEKGNWMLTDERSYRLGLLEGVVDEEVWSKI